MTDPSDVERSTDAYTICRPERPLNTLPKYVAPRTLSGPLEWSGAELLGEDIPKAVAAHKQEDGKDLHVVRSSGLMHTLIEHDLVDEFRLMIDPVIVGGRKQAFRDDRVLRSLRLVEGQVTTTGAYLATYALEDRSSGAGPSRRWC